MLLHNRTTVASKLRPGKVGRVKQEIMVVYHLLRKTGWSTAVGSGTRQILHGNLFGDAPVPFPRLFLGR